MFVGVVYRTPHAFSIAGTALILKLLTRLHDYGTKIILEDFNTDKLKMSDDDAAFIRNLIEENSLQSVSYMATYRTSSSDTWLDLCLVHGQ